MNETDAVIEGRLHAYRLVSLVILAINLLLLALAGMEICWFTPLFLAFTRTAWEFPPTWWR